MKAEMEAFEDKPKYIYLPGCSCVAFEHDADGPASFFNNRWWW
jgi:hypothetical protein